MKDTLDKKRRLLFVVPTPPPYAGPEISSEILLKSPLKDKFKIIHLRSNIHRHNAQRGKVSIFSAIKLLSLLWRMLVVMIVKQPYCVYTILNQNVPGFMRDSLIVILAKILQRKVVLHFRGSNFEYFYKNQSPWFQEYIRYILNQSDRIILQAQWVREKFKQFLPEERLCVIYNAVPEDIFKHDISQTRMLKTQDINVLFLNHLSVAKGFLDLLESSKMLLKQRQDINFIFAGDHIPIEKNIFFDEVGRRINFHNVDKAIKDVQEDSQLNGHMRFTGEITEMSEKIRLFQMADIFVLPSYSEGCPMSVLEAMAVGLPVIVTPVGALLDIIKEGQNGLFARIGDPQDLKEKIVALADNPRERNIMGDNNKKLMQSNFNIDIICSKLSLVFTELN